MRISKTQHVYLHNLAQRVWILYPFLQNRRSTHFTVHPWLSVLFKHMRSRPSFKLRCSIAGDNGSETGAGQTNVFVSPLSHEKFSNPCTFQLPGSPTTLHKTNNVTQIFQSSWFSDTTNSAIQGHTPGHLKYDGKSSLRIHLPRHRNSMVFAKPVQVIHWRAWNVDMCEDGPIFVFPVHPPEFQLGAFIGVIRRNCTGKNRAHM